MDSAIPSIARAFGGTVERFSGHSAPGDDERNLGCANEGGDESER